MKATAASAAGSVGPDQGCRPRAQRWAGSFCLIAGVLTLGVHALWFHLHSDLPPAVLAPAGEAMAGEAPFPFAFVGDSRGNMSVFEAVLEAIRADRVALILHGGDIVNCCDERQFEWVLHELDEERLSVPFCAVPGNHDIDDGAGDDAARYRLYGRAFGPRRYWFSYANSLFVAFDASTEHVRADDLRWLDDTLERYRKQYAGCFVYMHVPPVDPRPDKSRGIEEGKDEVARILKENDVTAVLASHIHSYAEGAVAGIPLYVSGGAGAELEGPGDTHHYLLCTVAADGSLDVQKKDVGYRADTDYPEYVFRVKFPDYAVLCVGIMLLVIGAIATGRGGRRQAGGGRSSG